jgi:5-methylcytosine-specific restriction endonuclease McrA
MTIHRKEFNELIQVKCPDCGEFRTLKKRVIYNWLCKNHDKTENEFEAIVPCKSCGNVRHGTKKSGLHMKETYDVKCSKCGDIRKVSPIAINTWLTEHHKTIGDYWKENMCRVCAGRNFETHYTVHGYKVVVMKPDDKFACMTQKHNGQKTLYCLEHRYIMAQTLGRPLEVLEVVHHKDGNKLNNKPENLEIVTRQSHLTVGFTNEKEKHYIDLIIGLRKEIDNLKAENENLKLPLDKS